MDELRAEYRMAFGRTTFDLRQLAASGTARTVDVRQAAGHVRILVAATPAVRIDANVHAGTLQVDGTDAHSGWGFTRTVQTGPAGDPVLTLDVSLADGAVTVDRSP